MGTLMRSFGGVAVLALAMSVRAEAAPGDRLDIAPNVAEAFSGTVADLETRYRLGISRFPNNVFTRTHVASGERQLWTGGGFLGLSIQPLTIRDGVLRIETRPLPAAALAAIATKTDEAATRIGGDGKPVITPAQAANLKAARWSSGMVASKSATGPGYYGARMMLSPVPGRWQAFYLFDWRLGLEIDVIESIGDDPRCFHFSTHSPFGYKPLRTGTRRVCLDRPLADGFHEYGVLIRGKEAILYVDRIERARLPMPNGSNNPRYPARWSWLAHVAVGGNWLEKPSYGVLNIPKPGSTSVTYVDAVLAPAG